MNNGIKKISIKSSNFLNSNYSIIFFLGGIIFFSYINFLLFGFKEGFSIETRWWGNLSSSDNNAWIGWIEMIIATIGSTLTIWGVILTIRFNKNFIYPLAIGEIFVIIDALLIGAIMTCFSYLLMLISAFYNFIYWKKIDKDNENKMNSYYWIFVFSFLIGYIILFSLINFKSGFYEIDEFNNWNDIVSSGIVVISWFILLRKSKWGFLGFLLTDITYMTMYFSAHLFSIGSSYIVYLFIDITSFLAWYNTN